MPLRYDFAQNMAKQVEQVSADITPYEERAPEHAEEVNPLNFGFFNFVRFFYRFSLLRHLYFPHRLKLCWL